MSKQGVGIITDPTIMFEKNRSKGSDLRPNKKCFKRGRKIHYARDCCSFNSNKNNQQKSQQRKPNMLDERRIMSKPRLGN